MISEWEIDRMDEKELRKWAKSLRTRYQGLKVEKRKLEIALKEEQAKKYDIYVEEDKLTYLQMESYLKSYTNELERSQQLKNYYEERNKELEATIYELMNVSDKYSIYEIMSLAEKRIKEYKKQSRIGSKAGRPPKADERTVAVIRELRSKGYSMRDIASQVNLSVGTVYNILQKYDNNEQ